MYRNNGKIISFFVFSLSLKIKFFHLIQNTQIKILTCISSAKDNSKDEYLISYRTSSLIGFCNFFSLEGWDAGSSKR